MDNRNTQNNRTGGFTQNPWDPRTGQFRGMTQAQQDRLRRWQMTKEEADRFAGRITPRTRTEIEEESKSNIY